MPAVSSKSSIVASLLFSFLSAHAFAACGGAATSAALSSFDNDPAAWLSTNAKTTDLVAHVEAIAAAAVNAKDPHFGKALNAMLARASADRGTAIGTAIAALGNACSDPRDPNDTADKQYISANIAPNLLANSNANAAYAKANGSETASGGYGGEEGGGLGGGLIGGNSGGVGGETGTTGFASGGFSSGGTINAPTGGIITSESRLTTFGASSAAIVSPH